MKTIVKILKAAFTKFSAINMTQYVGIATMVIMAWQGADLITPATVLMLTGLVTLILKFWQSSKEMVATGFSMDWSVYLSGAVGLVMGFLDTFIYDGTILTGLFGDATKWVLMAYMALTVVLRTGYTNQSLNTQAAKP